MLLGYNTNGFAHHDLLDAVEILAEIGYQSIAITIDHHALNPRSPLLFQQLDQVKQLLERHDLASVIETGAGYLLDPRHKHEPSLISPSPEGRNRRLEFYFHAVRCAAALRSHCVSIWSGKANKTHPRPILWTWLKDGLSRLLDYASSLNVRIALEPEPGMLIATLEDYQSLCEDLAREDLWLTLDVGHLQCQGEGPFPQAFAAVAPRVINMHLEDMRGGVHEHLFFGEGEIDFSEILATLRSANFAGPIHVELNRHSHDAPEVARRAFAFIRKFWDQAVLPNL